MGKANAIEEDELLQNLNQLDLLSIWQLTPEEEMAMKNAIAESEKS
jgi:transcription initiation factor IIF auxiliary subunit